MTIQFWVCKCGKANANGLNACRKCRSPRDQYTTDGTHIIRTPQPKRIEPPKTTLPKTDAMKGSAAQREASGETIFESFMNRAKGGE